MKSNVKVSYIEATTLEDIQKETNRELEVLQTNVKTTITNISMSKTSSEKGGGILYLPHCCQCMGNK